MIKASRIMLKEHQKIKNANLEPPGIAERPTGRWGGGAHLVQPVDSTRRSYWIEPSVKIRTNGDTVSHSHAADLLDNHRDVEA